MWFEIAITQLVTGSTSPSPATGHPLGLEVTPLTSFSDSLASLLQGHS